MQFYKYHVPFFLLGPNEIIDSPKLVSHFGSHVDTSHTLIELTLSGANHMSFGKNILSQNQSSVVNKNGINFFSDDVLNYIFLDRQTRELYQWKAPNRWLLNRINKERIEKDLLDIMTAYFRTTSYFLEEEWNKKSVFLKMQPEKKAFPD